MPKVVFLDGNIYNRLENDSDTREMLAEAVASGLLRIIATPVVVDELAESPFGGVPDWFPVKIEVESVAVLDQWHLGQARLGNGMVFTEHRGNSNKTRDAVIADSANASADLLVSNDRRCRKRLRESSSRCVALDYEEFRAWLARERT